MLFPVNPPAKTRAVVIFALHCILVTSASAFAPPTTATAPSPLSRRRSAMRERPFAPPPPQPRSLRRKMMNDDDENDDLPEFDDDVEEAARNEKEEEAARFRTKAEELRAQIRRMEEKIGAERKERYDPENFPGVVEKEEVKPPEGRTLKGKRVMVVGANGRLGSMVCRRLLRNHPEVQEVIAAVHYIGEASTRGWGRLSYEVGAEDGRGNIGSAWSEDREATFEYTDDMKDYNLNKMRIVDLELLDPVQCRTITEGVDSVIFCATDFNGNQPRAIASFDVALLFRAVASPMKGRVEIEGLRNVVEGLVATKQDRSWASRRNDIMTIANPSDPPSEEGGGSELDGPDAPIAFVLVSTSPDAFGEFETPFGEFNGLKRQGEEMLRAEFPSLSHAVLQMGLYDERMGEGLDVKYGVMNDPDVRQIQINRRDAAKAAVDALLDDDLLRKNVQAWTIER